MQALKFFIKTARGSEVSKLERTAGIFDPGPQNIERASFIDFGCEAFEKSFFDLAPVMLFQTLPYLRLCRIDEIENHARIEAKCFVIILRLSRAIAAGSILVSFQRLDNEAFSFRVGVGPPARSVASMVCSRFRSEMSTISMTPVL
jgi:hypothetical protein